MADVLDENANTTGPNPVRDGRRGDEAPGGDLADLPDVIARAARAFGVLEERLAAAGGVAPVVELYDRIRESMVRIDFVELDRVAHEIRDAIELLLRMDADVRKLNNLKVLIDDEARRVDAGRRGARE